MRTQAFCFHFYLGGRRERERETERDRERGGGGKFSVCISTFGFFCSSKATMTFHVAISLDLLFVSVVLFDKSNSV